MDSLKPWRVRIDALDDRIVDLLADRLDLIRQVGAIKVREGIPATLPDRVEEVIARAVARGAAREIDPAFTRCLYTFLVDYSCQVEELMALEAVETAFPEKIVAA